jgi:hypothetical protein
MDWLVYLLFESPLQLMAVLILLESILLTWWWFRADRRAGIAMIGLLLVGAVMLIVQHVVVTDREKIRQLLEDLALAVDSEDVRAFAAHIDEEYNADGLDKARLIERVATAFKEVKIDDVKLVNTKIKIEDDTATVNLRAHARVRGGDLPYEYHLSFWEVKLARRGPDWKVTSAVHGGDTGLSARDLLDIVRR